MKKYRIGPWVCAACLVPVLVWASAAVRLSFDQLISESDRVVVARVVERGESKWGPKHLRIYTLFTFEVEEEVAGEGPRRFSIVQPGGRVGRLAQRTDGYPSFAVGDRLLLFLRMKQNAYRVVGLSQGVFGFHPDGEREVIFQKLEGLHFPKDHGRPILLDRGEAMKRIRTFWPKSRQVSP